MTLISGEPGGTARTADDGGPDEAYGASSPALDHRTRPRRRGQVLERAIFEAVVSELAETGYAGFAMEHIAERARTGKASLYRRWGCRAELVLAATGDHWAIHLERVGYPNTGNLRNDLFAMLRTLADPFAGPYGEAVRGLLAELPSVHDHAKEACARFIQVRDGHLLAMLGRAAERGEIPQATLTPQLAGVGSAVLLHRFLTRGAPIPDEDIDALIDEIALPLLGYREPASEPLEREPRLDPLA